MKQMHFAKTEVDNSKNCFEGNLKMFEMKKNNLLGEFLNQMMKTSKFINTQQF